MKSRPRWMWWTAGTALLWAAWMAFAYLPLRQTGLRGEAERSEWDSKQQDMLVRIQTAPEVMAQFAALEAQSDSATQALPQTSMLYEYTASLADIGRQAGIRSVEVSPELASMMSLTKISHGASPQLDTLVVEFTATGGFHQVGTWLDQIELQSAFRYWQLARWDKGEEPGTVRFSGSAAFLVAAPRGDAS